jgi:hypothetical protein
MKLPSFEEGNTGISSDYPSHMASQVVRASQLGNVIALHARGYHLNLCQAENIFLTSLTDSLVNDIIRDIFLSYQE